MDEELVQSDVLDENLVQNGVMDGKFVKNFVMDAKIDPKVEMGPPMFQICGWKIVQLCNRKLVEEFIVEAATVALFFGILSRDSSLVMRYVGTSTRTSSRTFIVERIYEDEIHEHSDGIVKDAIGTE